MGTRGRNVHGVNYWRGFLCAFTHLLFIRYSKQWEVAHNKTLKRVPAQKDGPPLDCLRQPFSVSVMLQIHMYFKILASIFFTLIFASIQAEMIAAWGLDFDKTTTCKPESDICETKVLLKSQVIESVQISGLEGPIKLSIPNNQILSCESNAIMLTKAAKIFNLKGEEVFSISHRGYQSSCELTDDKKLYWFIYSKVLDSKPVNVILVVAPDGTVIYEKETMNAGEHKFEYNNKKYVVSTPAPRWPG